MTVSGMIALSVLTLNIWGLPGVGPLGMAPKKKERLQGICQELKRAAASTQGWDIVMLQEVWLQEDRSALASCGYPLAVDLNDSKVWLDSGLLILSKFPVQKMHRLTYPALPLSPDVLEDGEALVKKSAVLIKIEHPQMGPVWAGNTHLISYYAEGEADQYQERRKQQFSAFVQWAKERAGDEPLIIGGDWNFGAHNTNLWAEKNRLLPDFVVSSEAAHQSTLSAENTFQEKDQGRVDHLFASSHFQAEGGELAMHRRLKGPEGEFNLSDHFGWTEIYSLQISSRPENGTL